MNSAVTIHNKQFKPGISQQQILQAVKNVAGLINNELKNEVPIFLVVLNGAFMFAADLLKEISIPCEISFIKLGSYSGESSTGKVRELIGLAEDLTNRTIVIVEDIVDTGGTIEHLICMLKQKKVKQIKIATAFMKPAAYKKDHKIDYIGIEIGNDFVAGYGLDYNGFGRNLKEIYVLV